MEKREISPASSLQLNSDEFSVPLSALSLQSSLAILEELSL